MLIVYPSDVPLYVKKPLHKADGKIEYRLSNNRDDAYDFDVVDKKFLEYLDKNFKERGRQEKVPWYKPDQLRVVDTDVKL